MIDVNVYTGTAEVNTGSVKTWNGFAERSSTVYLVEKFTSPNRTVVHADWGKATYTDGCRTVVIEHADSSLWRTIVQAETPYADNFTRTRAGTGWGLADRGGKWKHTGGTDPGNYSVDGTRGTVTVDTALITRHSFLGDYDVGGDMMAEATLSTSRLGTPGGGQVYGVMLCRQDQDNNYRFRVELQPRIFSDTFTRTVSGGWGSSDTGNTWSSTGGTSADYSVASGVAKMTISAANSSRRMTISRDEMNWTVDTTVIPSATATGAVYTASIMLRYIDLSNHYLVRVEFGTAGTAFIRLQKVIAGVTTDLTTALGSVAYSPGTAIRLKGTISGDTIRGKFWLASGTEPASWTATATDTAIAVAGGVGLRSYSLSSNTNGATLSVSYDNFAATAEDGTDRVQLTIQKQVTSAFTTLATKTFAFTELTAAAGSSIKVRATRDVAGNLAATAWLASSSRPAAQLVVADTTFDHGKPGVFTLGLSGEASFTTRVDDFSATGPVLSPATVVLKSRVFVQPATFNGSVDLEWLESHRSGASSDLFDIATKFLPLAPPEFVGAMQVRGDAHYGPRDATGNPIEGADFNDYLGISWNYGGTVDPPEPAELLSLDCSGYCRMVFGPYGLGMDVSSGTVVSTAVPRISFQQVASGAPGIFIIANTGVAPTDLSKLLPGDVVGFDATSDAEEGVGQIDHTGIYMGLDNTGTPTFISSRKSPDGPTFSKTGGNSYLTGTGLYATKFRVAKRY